MKKMNRKFLVGTAFAAGAAATLFACGMPEPNVYGPAPTEQVETTKETTKETTEETTKETTSETTAETTSAENYETGSEADEYDQQDVPEIGTEHYSSESEISVALYGPPETFESKTEIQPLVYGPPEYFEKESEIQEDVYGPPSYFE